MSEKDPTPSAADPELPEYVDPLADTETRRSFFKAALTLVIGAVAVLTPVVTGVLFFLDPLIRRKKGSESEDFVKVDATLDSLPDDGTPQRVTIYADRVDAWNMFPDQQIGSVYLRKKEGSEVIAFNVKCPHLGCGVDYRAATQDFFCPCHTSAFDLEGQKKNQIPPRAMDSLEVQVRNGREIWVKYQDFRATISEKIPV